jgi:hypothetical protein
MDLLELTNAAVVTIGIPVIIGTSIYIGRKLKTLDHLEITSRKIKHNLKVVSDFLIKSSSLHFDPTELKNYSPLQLSPEGEKLIEALGFGDIFEARREEFFQFIDEEHPRLKYDVELAAIKAIHIFSEKEYMSPLKVFFYNNPKRNLENTAPTLAVYVRDKYLEKHPEITE